VRARLDIYALTTSAQREAIRTARRSGLTIADIKAATAEEGQPLSLRAVKAIICDVPPPKQRTGRAGADPELKARVIRAAVSGRPHRQIAEEFGVSTASVWKWSRRSS